MKTEYDFPVELMPIKANNIIIPKKVAVIRLDNKEPIGIVSNIYGLIKHKDIVDSFRESLSNYKYEEKIEVIKEGAHFFATYRLPEIQYEVRKNDVVAMQFITKNSYDGTKSFSLILGALRLVCTNGMIIGKELFSYTRKHISSEITFMNSVNLKDIITKLMSQFKDSIPLLKKMSTIEIKPLEKDALFDKKKILLPEYLIKSAKETFEKEQDKTIWGYYNSLTWSISHNIKKDKPQSRIDYSKQAWLAASKLLKV